MKDYKKLEEELSSWINRNSLENGPNFPDFYLASFLMKTYQRLSKAMSLVDQGQEKLGKEVFLQGMGEVWDTVLKRVKNWRG